MKVIQMDAINPRGLRNVIDGEAELVEGFEFNHQSKLGSILSATLTYTLDRVNGEAIVDIPSFVPIDTIVAPSGSTHYKMVTAAMDINFESGAYVSDKNETAIQPLDTVATTADQVTISLTAASVNPMFLVYGINFYQEVNGSFYELKNGSYNALQVVKVNGNS